MTPLAFVVASLAVYRATLLVTADEITEPLRRRILTVVPERVAVGLVCEWCVSAWLAPLAVGSALAWADGWGWWAVAGSLAASAVTGALASYARPG